jgi:hypothetical protein
MLSGIIIRAESSTMGSLDIPEVLIGMSILAILVWVAYNWTHRNVGERK